MNICCGACSYCIISGGGNWAENVASTAAEGFFLGLLPGDPLLKRKTIKTTERYLFLVENVPEKFAEK